MWLRPWHLINSSTSPTAIRLDQIWQSCRGASARRLPCFHFKKDDGSGNQQNRQLQPPQRPHRFRVAGGGAHGAFTWGALDRLLEESWLQIDGISGTPAGAMNAAVLVDGHARGGAEAARSCPRGVLA